MVYAEQIELQSNDKAVTFHNITDQVKEIVKKSGVTTGTVTVYSHHTTCCVITQEAAFDMSMTGLKRFSRICQQLPRDHAQSVFRGRLPAPGPKALAYAEQHGERTRLPQHRCLRSALVGRSNDCDFGRKSIWATLGSLFYRL